MLMPRHWHMDNTSFLHRGFLCHAAQLCNELLHESLLGHAVLFHELFVENVGVSGRDVQEVKEEPPVPLHSFVLCCVILNELVRQLQTSHVLVVLIHRSGTWEGLSVLHSSLHYIFRVAAWMVEQTHTTCEFTHLTKRRGPSRIQRYVPLGDVFVSALTALRGQSLLESLHVPQAPNSEANESLKSFGLVKKLSMCT